MNPTHVLAIDLAPVRENSTGSGDPFMWLAWGDPVELVRTTATFAEILVTRNLQKPDGSIIPETVTAFIKPTKDSGLKPEQLFAPIDSNKVLRVDFVDVQQGDASVVETPKGTVMLVDGGANQLFARYLANRFPGSSIDNPRAIDCIVVSHGDADHFAGLTEIHNSEVNPTAKKRLFMQPKRVYHNGLVKRPDKFSTGKKRPDVQMLGDTIKGPDGRPVIVELEENLLDVDSGKMNGPFKKWKAALAAYESRKKTKKDSIKFRRLEQGSRGAFNFLSDDGVKVEVLAPIMSPVGDKKGLVFLGEPREGPHTNVESLNLASTSVQFSGNSASHTINGHSVVLRLTYGDFRFLLAGDLNNQAELALVKSGKDKIQSEVLKAPHHGSADFSTAFLAAVSPVVSVVSSGDENERVEYIHPRATLIGALGRHSRIDEPLIFVTETVAFFRSEGWSVKAKLEKGADGKLTPVPTAKRTYYGFNRTAFGIVMVRTDGKRLLVYTNSGLKRMKEAYAYVKTGAEIHPVPVRQA